MTDRVPSPATLGHIQSDRPCARCGFNLYGLPITRDEHYHMPIARCAECGQVAALQEYPGLGVWAKRWSAMIAAVWTLFAIAMFAFTLSMASAPVGGMLDSEYSGIADAITEWAELEDPESSDIAVAYANNPNMYQYRPWVSVSDKWLETQDLGTRVRENGPLISQLDSTYPVVVGTLWLMLYATALPWTVMLLRASRIKVSVYLCLTFTIGAVIVGLIYKNQALSDTSPRSLALGIVWATLLVWTYPILMTAGILAAFTGRPLARLLIRAALPPRLRLPFAELWRADEKKMPAITGRSTGK